MQKINLFPALFIKLSIIAALSLSSGCASPWSKGVVRLEDSPAAVQALANFREEELLQAYFNDAVAIVIIPGTFRAGGGFGGAIGRGWLVRDEEIVNRIIQWQFAAGAFVGFQFYDQILFFKTEEALAKYTAMRLEFAGQANITALTMGKGWTPSYNEDVALFSKINGGLLVEGSVSMHAYHLLQP